MLEDFSLLLILPLGLLSFALFTNLYREHRQLEVHLKPNCLLTRNPVVFVTGLRSLFYFRKYWNSYPEVLAEHGYEVFTLHLPWQNRAQRSEKIRSFLEQQSHLAKKYHFVCDPVCFEELQEVLEVSPATASITVLNQNSDSTPARKSLSLNLAYRLHALRFSDAVPAAGDLGLDSPAASPWLLQKMQELGELDYLS